MKTAEKIYEGMFKKRFNQRGKMWEDHSWKIIGQLNMPKGKDGIVAKIQELMDKGCDVQAGWFSTAVRGWHEYIIIYKEKQEVENVG